RAALFQPFTRAEGVSAEGTGLGLAISRQLVEALGGRLECDSEPGLGATFWFELTMPVVATAPASAGEAEAGQARPRVLVADDDIASRELLATALRRAGYAVDIVGDGEAAVTSALAGSHVAVVLDVQLPELD